MFSTEDIYEVVIFSIGDTKAGTKMGKLQLKDTKDDSILNCILWEEALNRMDSKLFRTGNLLRSVIFGRRNTTGHAAVLEAAGRIFTLVLQKEILQPGIFPGFAGRIKTRVALLTADNIFFI